MMDRQIQVITIPPNKIRLQFAGYSEEEERYSVAAIETANSYLLKIEISKEKQIEYLEGLVKEINQQLPNFYGKKTSEEFGLYLNSKLDSPKPNEIN